MKALRLIPGLMLAAGLVAGTLADAPRRHEPMVLDGYRVLVTDFYAHSFPSSFATLSPWDTVLEARRQGLDAIAMTGHNHVWVAQVGRWFSRMIGGPTVLVGEEIVAPRYHMLAVGIHRTVSWRQSAAGAIDDIHQQGGAAIAAHPEKRYWRAYDAAAMSRLDAAEVLHPLAYTTQSGYDQLREFYARGRLTAVGDSDYHGMGPLGLCRTFVFAREDSEGAIVEALRSGHTVVVDRDGRTYGDPELVRLAAQDPRFAELRSPPADDGVLTAISRICAMLGLVGAFVFRPGWSNREN